ncbi:hypothetical protein EK21DRAFT_92130 [Setomelanomma holmii]|uniref:C2H2-type domain-containing protein n=1 Tax=Setomelanomma holmii TaxID=210430 RepID=A0A9P4LK78_9PLEO|nr:hypothetical protein EK21DRAFT_92130 [Setomelanomma holmii]
MVSDDRGIWRRTIRVTKRILDDSLPDDGLTGHDAISLVLLADIMRFVPGLEMHRFCSSQEFEADLPRYAQMVTPEERCIFDRFVYFMYGVTIDHVSFETTQNMIHFRDLFKKFASKTGGSSTGDGETSSVDQVSADVWSDDRISTDHLELPPALEVLWKPKEIDVRSLDLLLAATLIFGLMLAFLLEWNTSIFINDAMHWWYKEYGDVNTRWSATVARNCLVAATFLAHLKNTDAKLNEIPLDHGLPRIEVPELSAEARQSGLNDTMPSPIPQTCITLGTSPSPCQTWPTFNTPQSLSQTPNDFNTPSALPPSPSPTSSGSGALRTCPYCQTDFANTSSFNQHIRHPPKRCPATVLARHQHTCQHCGRRQTNKANLGKHVQRHCKVLKERARM